MNPFYTVFVYGVWFLATYYLVFLALLLFLNRNKLYETKNNYDKSSFVSIIVPAFNEEEKIVDTIKSLKNVKHENIEFIIINDGSKDKTSEVVNNNIKGDQRFVFLNNKKNKGKAACLNEGINIATGKFIACMDADSIVQRDIFKKTLPYFDNDEVGAVTVSVELRKPKGLLHKIIDLEYIIGLSLFLKLFSLFNCVFVTPGPFSIYRKKVLIEIGSFDVNNITEDLEIAYRIQKQGYKIRNCMEAKVKTITPPTFKEIYAQRKRWYSGAIHTLIQHRDIVFNKKLGLFGFFIPYNYTLVFLGLMLFMVSTFMGLSNLFEQLWFFKYTHFNFLDRIFDFDFDLLRLSAVSFIGFSSLLAAILIMVAGLKFTNKEFKTKKIGMLAYPFIFFLYQIFWTGAIIAVLRGKKIKWR